MNVEETADRIEAIKNIFLGFEPGSGFDSAPGPRPEVRIARAVLWLDGLRQKLLEDSTSGTQASASVGSAAGRGSQTR
jgi:hypothetical protein